MSGGGESKLPPPSLGIICFEVLGMGCGEVTFFQRHSPPFPLLTFSVELSLFLDRETEEVDEALSVVLVIVFVDAEGRGLFVVEGERGGYAGVDEVALVELEFDVAGDGFVRLVDERADGFPAGV